MDCLNTTARRLMPLESNLDDFFLIIMGCLVFFMQAGFAFLESGSVRSKNTTNILLKNFLNVCLGSVVYYAFGFGLAFGEPGNPFSGERFFFLANLTPNCYAFWFFQLFFAVCASTIVSGALAERTEFVAYMVSSCVITGFIFPIVSHWQWAKTGWLYNGPGGVQFKDYAGCGAVHVVGGTASLVGAVLVGPRLGRFDTKGTHTIEGHTLSQVAMGGFILFMGFFAFNGGAHLGISKPGDGPIVAKSAINTMLAGGMGALSAIGIRRLCYRKKHWSLIIAINGGLTGMVSNGAGSNVVEPWGSALTGTLAGLVYIFVSSSLVKLKVDDPVHATAVHLGGGLLGLLSAPFLDYENGLFSSKNTGLAFWTLGWNILGSVVIFLWTAIIIGMVFGALKAIGKLRVPPEVERKGLDIAKHGEAAYPLAAYGHGWYEEAEHSENELDEVVSNGQIQDEVDYNGEMDSDVTMDRKGDAGVYIGEEEKDGGQKE